MVLLTGAANAASLLFLTPSGPSVCRLRPAYQTVCCRQSAKSSHADRVSAARNHCNAFNSLKETRELRNSNRASSSPILIVRCAQKSPGTSVPGLGGKATRICLHYGKVGGIVLGASVGPVGPTGTGTIGPGVVITGIPSIVAHGSQGFTGWHWHRSQTCTGGQIRGGWQGCIGAGQLSRCGP